MSIRQGALQQTRELLKHDRLNLEQLQTLARNANLCGEFPEPSGYKDGEPYWTREAIYEWSETTKRSRNGLPSMATRSMVATLLGREQKRETDKLKSGGELAEAAALGKITIDEADARCVELGISAASLAVTVDKIEERKKLAEQLDHALEAQEEAQRLAVELEINEAECAKALAPFRAKGKKLSEEKAAAERVANSSIHAERRLRETIPDWLGEAINATRAAVNGPEQHQKYQRGQLQRAERQLQAINTDLQNVDRQLAALNVQKSDFEGKLRQNAMGEKKAHLLSQAETLEADKLRAQQALDDTSDQSTKARKWLQKLEALIFEVWPKPTDIDA